MSNTEKKRILKNAFSELLDQVLPDDEQITKKEAIAVLTKEDIYALIGDALGVTPKVAPVAPPVMGTPEPSETIVPIIQEEEDEE